MTAPASGPDQDVAAAIGQALGDIEKGVDELVTAVDNALAALPDALVGWVRDGVAALGRLIDELFAQVGRICAEAGSPSALRAAGRAWTTTVTAQVSGLAGTVTLDHLQAEDRWSGAAADAYRNTLIPQSNALQAVTKLAADVDSGLQEFAGALSAFWASMINALALLATAIFGELTTATAPPATLLAMASIVGTIAAGVAFVKAMSEGLTTFGNAAATRTDALMQRLDDNSAFPSGSWPVSTTDMSDGSVTDGDPSDWTVK